MLVASQCTHNIIIRHYHIIICLAIDFINITSEVQFGPNQTEAHVLVHAQKDFILETNEEFIVKLELMEEDRMIGLQLSERYDSAIVTIINNNGIMYLCLVFIRICSYVVTYCFSL